MEMKEMVYAKTKDDRARKSVLYEGDYMAHHFVILNIGGMHPTAYVENKYGLDYNFLDDKIIVHGGLTYGNYGSYNNWNDDSDHRHYIGWDYGHVSDWAGFMTEEENIEEHNKKWTTPEIYEEVKSVIEQLIKLEEVK